MSSIRIRQRSITSIPADIVVNAANSRLYQGGGVCGAIFEAAGADQLTQACRIIGGCPTGSAVLTPAFRLGAKYIIHAVGPIYYDGFSGEPEQLFSCYTTSLELCRKNNCHKIVFPLISSGIFGYPKYMAWEVALNACKSYIRNNPDYELEIIFAIPDPDTADLGMGLLNA